MAIPAYLWLKDDGGADIMGSVDVQDRDGSIEITGFSHNLSIPTDAMTGKSQEPASIQPYSFKKSLIAPARIFTKQLPLVRHLNQRNLNGIASMMLVRKRNTSTCCLKV